jgi:Domain of unknown function (DUF309)
MMSLGPGAAIDRAFTLYASGDALEAHEVLEEAWHEEGRAGLHATLLKALIRVCAARVKLAQGVERGMLSHTDAALALLEELTATTGARELLRVRFDDVVAEVERVRGGEPPGVLARAPAPED